MVFAAHTSLHIEGVPGSATDVPLRISVVDVRGNLAIRVLRLGPVAVGEDQGVSRTTTGAVRQVFYVDDTPLTNARLVDADGAHSNYVTRAFAQAQRGRSAYLAGWRDCNSYALAWAHAFANKDGWKPDQALRTILEGSNLFYRNAPFPKRQATLQLVVETVRKRGDPSAGLTRDYYDISDPATKKLEAGNIFVTEEGDEHYHQDPDPLPAPAKPARAAQAPPDPLFEADPVSDWVQGSSDTAPATSDGGSTRRPNKFLAFLKGLKPGTSACRRDLTRRCELPDTAGPKSLTVARVNNIATTIELVSRDRAVSRGAGLAILAPLFLVVDIVNGQPAGEAIGALSVLGSVADLFLGDDNPVGWIIGGVLAFIGILAGQAPPNENWGDVDNVTQIVQQAMFGDPHLTGNEKCQQGTTDQPGNPNCTVLYGPGILSAAFGWDNFDPIAFLIHFNEGKPMSVPDIAASFYVLQPGVPHDGSGKSATISCNPRTPCGRTCPPYDPKKCRQPSFRLQRSLIHLPELNQTADRVYPRVIPNAGGDCMLVPHVGPVNYTRYNLTVSGGPVAIACNLTDASQQGGLTVTLDTGPSRNTSGTGFSSSNTSTDDWGNLGGGLGQDWQVSLSDSASASANQTQSQPSGETGTNQTQPESQPSGSLSPSTDGESFAVPYPHPLGFADTLNETNAVCMSGAGGTRCFPNGTYQVQLGSLGFDSTMATTLQMPSDARLALTVVSKIQGRFGATTFHPSAVVYTATDPTDRLASQMSSLSRQTGLDEPTWDEFDALVPEPAPPALCLFTQPQYRGDMICYGPGSGNLSSAVTPHTQSLMLFGAVTAYLYGSYLGDKAPHAVYDSVPDLNKEAYGDTVSYAGHIMALWVIPSTVSGQNTTSSRK